MKTRDLIGPALDWAVSKCAGWRRELCYLNTEYPNYSENWSLAGPIIERELINVCCASLGGWVSTIFDDTAELLENSFKFRQYGTTPIVAAMRCYVASKMGDDIDVPSELIGE
jgi:hypothetical protein